MKRMMIIGLIGGIACGKSTALEFFQDQGIDCFSADKIAHQLLKSGTTIHQAIIERLGTKAQEKNGELNRAYLRQLLIEQIDFKIWLEELMHPEIQKQLQKLLKSVNSNYCVLEIPLLKDPKLYHIQRILCIDCNEKNQIKRLKQRQLNSQEIQGLLALQIPRQFRLDMADDILENNQDKASFQKKLQALHQRYLRLTNH
jgi:dephospho-CoA kinase